MSTNEVAQRWRAYLLSWLAYATYYLGRKGFSIAKSTMALELGLSPRAMALVDTSFLVAYAIGQVPSGLWADRVGSRRLIGLGMTLSACACLAFSASDHVATLALFFGLNGLAQATGWPAATKIVAQWAPSEARGRSMGMWSTCYQIGGIAATAFATFALAHAGFRAAFRWPACMMLVVALCVTLWLPHSPAQRSEHVRTVRGNSALRNPRLYRYGACYFCLKLMRYSLLFWLPYYLHTGAGLDAITSGYVSTAFEVGGAAGSIGVGAISDRFNDRARVASLSLLSLSAVLLWYGTAGSAGWAWHALALALLGALLFGPDALISGAAAQEAAEPEAAATAVGLVNGLGSAGALFQGALTVGVQEVWGWSGVFHCFVGLALISALSLWPRLVSDPAQR